MGSRDPNGRRWIWGPRLARAGARGLHPSHRWNRFWNRIDPPLLLAGRELRLVSAGGRARGPHGLGLLRRPPGCTADRSAGQGRSGSGWGSRRRPARPGGWGREGGRLNGPGTSRLPPPGFSAPEPRRPAPEPGSTPRLPRPPACSPGRGCITPPGGQSAPRAARRQRCHSFLQSPSGGAGLGGRSGGWKGDTSVKGLAGP